ncbi:hypothetical protein K7X08_012950 [Anisodus acutangulus]|uniref:Syntaxin 6/10/61 N-terminal domain-containing protein n=1 Tax=Anisodus acutangulus TaxID=402998 RepID=A0A9Q1RE08_9SOLA|nr:hypothetical protein K7X08_012950 [Anisodus acutangulus]
MVMPVAEKGSKRSYATTYLKIWPKTRIRMKIDKLLSTFHRWEQTPAASGEQVHFTKELLAACESIEWQVDELDKTIDVAARGPSWYGIDRIELDKRRRWTSNARAQV